MILKGKVIANEAVNDNVGLASGTAIFIALGAAMYEALAARIARRKALRYSFQRDKQQELRDNQKRVAC